MTHPDPHEMAEMAALDALLVQAGRTPEPPPAALLTRVLADADACLPVARAAVAPRGLGLLARLAAALGGWQAMGGLAAAACAGFWIGVSPPAILPDAGQIIFGLAADEQAQDLLDLTELGWSLEEGIEDAG